MASMILMFEKKLLTSDELMFSLDGDYLWDCWIVSTSACQVTIYQPTKGQQLGTNTQWYIANAVRLGANSAFPYQRLFTTADRDVRAYSNVSDTILRGIGVRL